MPRLSTVLGAKSGWISSTGPSCTPPPSHKPILGTCYVADTGLGARIWGNEAHEQPHYSTYKHWMSCKYMEKTWDAGWGRKSRTSSESKGQQ